MSFLDHDNLWTPIPYDVTSSANPALRRDNMHPTILYTATSALGRPRVRHKLSPSRIYAAMSVAGGPMSAGNRSRHGLTTPCGILVSPMAMRIHVRLEPKMTARTSDARTHVRPCLPLPPELSHDGMGLHRHVGYE